MIWRPPTLGEFIHEASDISGSPVRDLLAPKIAAQLERALDDVVEPASLHAAAAAMCGRLLRILPTEAPRVVEWMLRESLERSDARWKLDGLSTVMYMQAWQRRPAGASVLATWMAQHIETPAERRAVDWTDALADHVDQLVIPTWVRDDVDGRGEPAVFLSGPLANLDEGCALHIELIHGDVIRGMEAAVASQPRPIPVRLMHPCLQLPPGERPRDEWLTEIEDLVLEEADGFILTDVGQRAPGFGSGVEFLEHALRCGPRLVLADTRCDGHSRLESALAQRIGAQIEAFHDHSEIPVLVAEWMDSVYEEILAARRRRLNRRLIHEREVNGLRNRLTDASDQVVKAALRRSGMSAAQLARALRSVAAWEAIPWGQLRELQRELGSTIPKTRPRPKGPPRPSIVALNEAADRMGWSAERRDQLLHDVQRELTTAGADHRLTLLTPDDWIAAYERLHRAN